MIRPDVVAKLLMLAGSALLLVSAFVPVMRWTVNAAHTTGGSARVFTGGGWTLADGGFGGEQLLPVALAAGVAWGPLAWLEPRTWVPPIRRVLAAVAAYYPVWVAMVFVRKWEDDVAPSYGAGLLVVAVVTMAAGWFTARTRAARGLTDAVA